MKIDRLLTALNKEHINHDEKTSLSSLSHTKTGSTALTIIYPKNEKELIRTLSLTHKFELSYLVFGDMTNVAFATRPLNKIIISMLDFYREAEYDAKGNVVTVDAGMKMKDLAKWGYKNSVNAFQWMEGIPGTIGAGVFMNAGFLPGQDIGSFLIEARVLMPNLEVKSIKNAAMDFRYRKSILQSNKGIVLSAKFLVRRGKKWKIGVRMLQYHERRRKHQPLRFPSAGTVFVPPIPYHVGGMINDLRLRGYRIGGAEISELSPGFIIGREGMTGEDYYALVNKVKHDVFDRYGIRLEPEVRLIGFHDGDSDENNSTD